MLLQFRHIICPCNFNSSVLNKVGENNPLQQFILNIYLWQRCAICPAFSARLTYLTQEVNKVIQQSLCKGIASETYFIKNLDMSFNNSNTYPVLAYVLLQPCSSHAAPTQPSQRTKLIIFQCIHFFWILTQTHWLLPRLSILD